MGVLGYKRLHNGKTVGIHEPQQHRTAKNNNLEIGTGLVYKGLAAAPLLFVVESNPYATQGAQVSMQNNVGFGSIILTTSSYLLVQLGVMLCLITDIIENREFLGVFKQILEAIAGHVWKDNVATDTTVVTVDHLDGPGPSAQRHVVYRVPNAEAASYEDVRRHHERRRASNHSLGGV